MQDSLGDRMKRLEEVSQTSILPRCTAILRIDGRAFHTFTKRFDKPFDERLHDCFVSTTKNLMQDIGGTARLGYTQSDEVSILLFDCNKFTSEHWFGGKIQKICSVAASVFTGFFNNFLDFEDLFAAFDARIFSIPEEEVPNYFLWRQQDCRRNAIQGHAQQRMPHHALQGKSCKTLLETFPNFDKNPPAFILGTTVLPDLTSQPVDYTKMLMGSWKQILKREQI